MSGSLVPPLLLARLVVVVPAMTAEGCCCCCCCCPAVELDAVIVDDPGAGFKEDDAAP